MTGPDTCPDPITRTFLSIGEKGGARIGRGREQDRNRLRLSRIVSRNIEPTVPSARGITLTRPSPDPISNRIPTPFD